MSSYKNFISDFPARTSRLLSLERMKSFQGSEVTIMLCVAMPSFLVPLERLTKPRVAKIKGEDVTLSGHPLKDWERFEQARSALESLRSEAFRGSRLWPKLNQNPWLFGELAQVSNELDSWPELQAPDTLGSGKTVSCVLSHIRNALAHGNILTRGNPQIEQIILLSKPRDAVRFKYLAVAPADFRVLLKNWLTFLDTLELPEEFVAEHVEASEYASAP